MTEATDYEVLVTAPEHAELAPAERDGTPLAPDEVRGPARATLVSPGTELAAHYTAAGRFPRRPGYAAVFEVEEVGEEVADLRPGDLAFTMGKHRLGQRAARQNVVPVPTDLSAEVAVFSRLMCVSMTTIATTRCRPPERVMVTGLGPVGHLAAAMLSACGYEVLATDPVAARRKLVEAKGIATTFEDVPVDDPEVAGQVGLVVECSGHEAAVLGACRVVRPLGEVVLVGVPWRRRTEILAHDILSEVFHRYVVLRSGWEWELPHHPPKGGGPSIFGNIAGALRWLAEGRVDVSGLYRKVSPREAQATYQSLLKATSDALSVVFDWTQCP